jgi:hypothetical protein
MPVKYWSFAGLLMTYWCDARCASCYLNCGPDRTEWLDPDRGAAFWEGLVAASAQGCRVHLTGGEPFGRWELLIGLCRRAKEQGLGPLEKVETNASWGVGEKLVRDRLAALDDAGMHKLVVSTDPYHQEFVPIERARLLARVAEDVLGAHRIQVRWRDWLARGFDTGRLAERERNRLFAQYASAGRDRQNGRAADRLAPLLPARPAREYANQPCSEALLRSRHVHVGPDGLVMPGVCAGIVLGRLGPDSAADVWRRLDAEHDARPIVSTLAREGPVGLLPGAAAAGFAPAAGYADKCHLCWDVRRFFVREGMHLEELGPAWAYVAGGRGRPDSPSSLPRRAT